MEKKVSFLGGFMKLTGCSEKCFRKEENFVSMVTIKDSKSLNTTP